MYIGKFKPVWKCKNGHFNEEKKKPACCEYCGIKQLSRTIARYTSTFFDKVAWEEAKN
jgi:hypothetical protein